jgi:hypothetical protein
MAKNDEITFDDLEPTAEVANALAAHEKESSLARERAAAALAAVNAEIDAETNAIATPAHGQCDTKVTPA